MRILILFFVVFTSCSLSRVVNGTEKNEARLTCLDSVLRNFDEMSYIIQNIGSDTIRITDFMGSPKIPITLEYPNGEIEIKNNIVYPNPIYEWKISPGEIDTFRISIHAYFDRFNFTKDSIYSIGIDFKDFKVNEVSCAYHY